MEDFGSKVDLNHQRDGEVIGTAWLHPGFIIDDCLISLKLLTIKNNKFDRYKLTKMLKDVSLLIDTERNPFYSLGCQIGAEAEVFHDICDYVQDYALVKKRTNKISNLI